MFFGINSFYIRGVLLHFLLILQRMAKMTRRLGSGEVSDPEAGAFMGFHSSESSDSESEGKPLLQGTLLDGLGNWLDRLFEGSTHRYYINYWPDFMTK